MLIDAPLAELEVYRPQVAEPADFDQFWQEELAAVQQRPLDGEFVPVASRLTHADIFDVRFAGYGGNPIKGWLLVPHVLADRPSMVVEFIGYGGGRGSTLDWLTFSCAGHPHLVMDTRGQGGGWRRGDTADPHETGVPGGRGFLVRGVLDPHDHYYTRLYLDAARAVEAAIAHPVSHGLPVVTTGVSQGGGVAIAAAHLAAGVDATMPDVPFLSNFQHAVRTTLQAPYNEIVEHCALYPDQIDRVFASLSYLDVVNHAKRIRCPALFSVGLVDEITPASTVFAAYNHYAGPKTIEVYPYNGHEGGGSRHLDVKLAFLDDLRAR
jgi:cephalosporin-C deacetylase